MLIKECVCGTSVNNEFHSQIIHNIPTLKCPNCSAVHQNLFISEKEYFNYYTQVYDNKHHHLERYDHDKEVANLRWEAYIQRGVTGQEVLDIGSSNGAFLDVSVERGYKPIGLELSNKIDHSLTKNLALRECIFAEESFDIITMHDVLEHFIEPVEELKETARITRSGGFLIVDFPNFWVEAGKHHWKEVEHLWFLTESQVIQMIEKEGYFQTAVYSPIESKRVHIFKKS